MRILVGLLALSFSLSGAVLVDNLAELTRGTTVIEGTLWAAQAFSTDAQAYKLDDIVIQAGLLSGSPALTVELRKGAPNGALLTGFVLPSFAGSLGPRTLLPLSATNLDPTTEYWLIVGISSPNTVGWSHAEGNAYIGPGAFGNYAYSNDGGATWGAFGSDNPYKMRVNVSAAGVPEPSSFAMFGFAVLAVGFIRRRAVQ